MRAPLRAMQGFGEILLQECADCMQDERAQFLRRIADSAGRMDKLITDALNYTKAVREELELEPISVKAVLEGIVDSYPQFQAPNADIQIARDIPPVLANEAGLIQCFSNLLGNAIKFVASGVQPKVRVWAEPRQREASANKPGLIRIWFEDNGIGIPRQYQQQIFVMFQRLSRKYEGTGIGLALVRKVMERMKGRVGVESEEGKGSRFWLELQAAPP
jgi:signal transduction histidine kinase